MRLRAPERGNATQFALQPPQVQQECIPNAIHGKDILCQAKSGMGKTAVFVLSVLNMMGKDAEPLSCLVIANTRELADQINKEFDRLGKYLTNITSYAFFGGEPIENQKKLLKNSPPQVIVGTPGRLLDLARNDYLSLSKIKWFIVDECDDILSKEKMR